MLQNEERFESQPLAIRPTPGTSQIFSLGCSDIPAQRSSFRGAQWKPKHSQVFLFLPPWRKTQRTPHNPTSPLPPPLPLPPPSLPFRPHAPPFSVRRLRFHVASRPPRSSPATSAGRPPARETPGCWAPELRWCPAPPPPRKKIHIYIYIYIKQENLGIGGVLPYIYIYINLYVKKEDKHMSVAAPRTPHPPTHPPTQKQIPMLVSRAAFKKHWYLQHPQKTFPETLPQSCSEPLPSSSGPCLDRDPKAVSASPALFTPKVFLGTSR